MDPTTLVTFIFRAPVEVRTVELLGSWDNFDQPYRMHNDRRRGTKFWTGCFKFENIIFDGDKLQWKTPRSGGLQQGGTYWYYYRLNYDVDAYDERQPHTAGCPLLPGQTLNVIDVPVEIIELPDRCHSAHGDIIGNLASLADKQTMDPNSKFACLEPPPISKVHARCFSDEALDGRLENGPVIAIEREPVSPLSTSSSSQTRPRSAGSKISKRFMRNIFSRASSVYSRRSTDSRPRRIEHVLDGADAAYEGPLPHVPHPVEHGPEPLASHDDTGSASPAHEEPTRTDSLQPPENTRRVSGMSIGAVSVQNVQFYGSRPGTSLDDDEEPYQPRIYSVPSHLELRQYLNDEPPIQHQYADRLQSDSADADTDEPHTGEDSLDFELVSPTFSAATISTNGQNTPFRLSTHNSLSGSTHGAEDTESLGGVVDRLKSLVTRSERSGSVASSKKSYELPFMRSKPSSCINYSLPTIASESTLAVDKTACDPATTDDLALPNMLGDEAIGKSMAEDIFSELGFLSAVIA